MEEFKIVFTKIAQRDTDRLEPRTRLRILQAIKALETNPFPKGDTVKKLKGARIPLYRLRIGDFRAVYHIDGRKVVILFIVDRKDFEKKLRTLL